MLCGLEVGLHDAWWGLGEIECARWCANQEDRTISANISAGNVNAGKRELRPAGTSTSSDLIPLDPSQIIDDTFRNRAGVQDGHPWRRFLIKTFKPSVFVHTRAMWIGFGFTFIGGVVALLAPEAAGLLGVAYFACIIIGAFALMGALATGVINPNELNLGKTSASEEARFLAFNVLDQAPEARLLTGREGNGVYMNRSYSGLFNISERLTVTLEQIFAGEDKVLSVLYRLQRAASGGGRHAEDVFLSGTGLDVLRDRHQGGVWIRISVRPVDRSQSFFVWEVKDISDEKAYEEVQAHRTALSLAALDDMPGGLVILSNSGQVKYANPMACEWLGATRSELQNGQLITDYVKESIAGDVLIESALSPSGFPGVLTDDGVSLESPNVVFRAHEISDENLGGQYVLLFHPADNAPPTPEPAFIGGSDIEAGFAPLFDAAPIGIAIVGEAGKLLKSNEVLIDMVGNKLLPGDPFDRAVDKEDRDDLRAHIEATANGTEDSGPLEVGLASDDEKSCQIFASRLSHYGEDGAPAVILFLINTTEQKLLEMQFAQSQKMQAVGQLAGGVAHDFNNVLTAIIGHCDLLLMQHNVGDPSFADINQIRQNANRAANLVRQLLAFSRRQTLVPKVLLLTDAIAETKVLLDRLLGEKVTLKQEHSRDLGYVKVDQGQLEQVLINLAVNARDAMKEDGELTIRTYNVSPEETGALGHTLMSPADYICLEIEDTGCGIGKETLGKIFEPFFTTKNVGEGTGLGLSTVYGIVKQTGGFIFPDSELGKGTVFRIYLPRHSAEEVKKEKETAKKIEEDLTGVGTVLLVEDEEAVRSFAARALTGRGYRVLEAHNGEVALEIVAEENGAIDIMVSDVVMPTMDGPTMAKKLRETHPEIKIIFISGYAEDAFADELDRPEDFVFLPKPFSLKQLAAKVKEVMGPTKAAD